MTSIQLMDYLAKQGQKANQTALVAGDEARESAIHVQIMDYCRSKAWYFVHSRTDKRTTQAIGVPDFVIATPSGKVWWIEVKRPKGKPTREQLAVGVMLKALGHNHAVIHSLEELISLVSSPHA